LSQDVAQQALQCLTDNLSQGSHAHLRADFVQKCLGNLKRHESVVMSLRVLRTLTSSSSSPTKRKRNGMGTVNTPKESQRRTIRNLIKTEDLMSLLVEDLDHFKMNKVVKNASSMVGKFPYMIHITERLAFMEYVLSTTHSLLSIAQVTTFWSDLVINALVPAECNAALVWLVKRTRASLSYGSLRKCSASSSSSSSSSSSAAAAAEDIMLYLFKELVPFLPVEQLSKEGFDFFDFLFRHINFEPHKLTMTAEYVSPSFFSLHIYY
jgi:hypothetical protein